MNSLLSDARGLVAREAIDQLAAAVQTILQLEELLKAARPGLGEHTSSARLIELGIYAAADQANGFDCAREDLEGRLRLEASPRGAAPRNAISPESGAGGAA